MGTTRTSGLTGNETPTHGSGANVRAVPLHPAWAAFLRFCADLRYGEIEHLSIQDGLPVMAEVTKKKVKFPPG